MKRLGIYLMTILFSISGFSQDYFWVGDGGNWSDLSHWATTSGGDTFHTVLPGPDNDVYFDANSFTKPNQLVTIDVEESHCRNFTTKGVLHAPTIKGVGFYDKLYVYGDFHMTDEMKRSFTMIYMMSDTLANVTTGELALGGFIQFVGGGTFHLKDSVSVNNFYVYDSDLYTNDHPIYASARVFALNGNPVFKLGRSNVYTNMWRVMAGTELDADSATIYFGSTTNILRDFFGGGKQYHRVVFAGEVRLFDNNVFDVFESMPGADITLAAGSVQTAGAFVLNGSAVQPISLRSSQTGTQASLSQSEGVVDATYLILQDNAAIGGAEFNALESIDLGNNTGWNISITEPQDYYWVGGAGNWEDANHWATTSGGDQLHDAPPSALDDVFFDEHSGLEEGDVVALGNYNWSCNNFTLTNISQAARINQTGSGNLNIYGNFIAEGDVILTLSNINFLSEEEVTLSLSAGALGADCTMNVNVLGDFQLRSPLLVRRLFFENGHFYANGNNIQALFELNLGQSSSLFVDMSDIELEVHLFYNFSVPGAFNIENTEITSSGAFYSNDQDYHRIIFEPTGSSSRQVMGSFSADEMIVLPGALLELQAGATITTGALSLEGTSDAPIEIISTEPGTEAFFSQSTGTVNGNHLILKDNHALGGATFIANNSELNDNVVGWNLNTSTSMAQQVHTDQMYPNPASDQIHVKGDPGETFRIFDLSGRLIQSLPLNEGWNRIDVGSLSPGVYVTQTSGMHRAETERLVVHR